jgi:myosin-5
MCSAANRLPHLHLENQQKFHYLNQGNSPDIEGISDLSCFDDTITALTMLGFSSKQQDDMLRILSSILHLGNVKVKGSEGGGSNDSDSCFIAVSPSR